MQDFSMAKFLHTSDWQLGMRRHFLDEESLPRFMQARIDAIDAIGRLAAEQECSFVVACGDVFDSNHLARRTVVRALEALAGVPCPVYLLPGNHDPLDAGSIYTSKAFSRSRPGNVHVLTSTAPVHAGGGVEIVGVPWMTRSPLVDLVARACDGLGPAKDVFRICVAHGIVDELSPDRENPALLGRAGMEAALRDGRVHYLALGDRHSATRIADRIWYSGSPEPTDYDEVDSGKVLVVELAGDECRVEPHVIGRWRFMQQTMEFSSQEDIDAARRRLEEIPDKDTTILKLTLKGSLGLGAKARLDSMLEETGDLLAALEIWQRHKDLVVLPDNLDMDELGLAGFARAAVEELRIKVEAGGDEAAAGRDALALLYRLVMGAKP
jgi:DNA repair exonuclease SbcCD nuclease subunit